MQTTSPDLGSSKKLDGVARHEQSNNEGANPAFSPAGTRLSITQSRTLVFTALLAVGTAAVVFLALQHAWITALIVTLVLVPGFVVALARSARRGRIRASR